MAASDQGGHSRIYRETGGASGATAEVFASGAVARFEQGSSLLASGQITFGANSSFRAEGGAVFTGGVVLTSGQFTAPGSLARGYIPLNLTNALAKTTATASGVVPLTTGTNPQRHNPDITSGFLRTRWTSAAGFQNPLYLEPIRIPNDLSTAGGIRVHLFGEAASADAQKDVTVNARAGTATAAFAGTVTLTTTPTEQVATLASGSIPTAAGLLSLSMFPTSAHASGSVDLYGAALSYAKLTS